MKDKEFHVGEIYFRLIPWTGPSRSHAITSWIYRGTRVSAGVDEAKLDGGTRNLCFVEWESWHRQHEWNESSCVTAVNFVSLADARVSMLSWQELLDQINFLEQMRRRTDEGASELAAEDDS